MSNIELFDRVNGMLSPEQSNKLNELSSELDETYVKKQFFRTQTEMLFSVLEDGKHPTIASKYWQAVREQSVFYEQLISLSFKYRTNEINIMENQEKLKNEALDKYERMRLEVDLDAQLFSKKGMQIEAKDRMRELELWSQIKTALVEADPDFATEEVDVHQADSYLKRLEHRKNALTPQSGHADIANVYGQLNTLKRLLEQRETPLANMLKDTISNKQLSGAAD